MLALTVLLAAVTVLAAPPAWAHGRGSDATNYLSTITSAPQADGVTFEILGGDEQLSVAVHGGHEVIVRGHYGEPYLRVNAQGAFENRRSPTVALHRERYRTTLPPGTSGEVDADAPPQWERVSAQPRWAWHDHRIHWMAPTAPDVDGETVLIPRWEVPVTIDGVEQVVAGRLRWIPPPPWPPWLLAGLVLTAPALWGLRRPPEAATATQPVRWPSALRTAGAVVAAVALVNVVHVVADLSGPVPLQSRLFAAAQTLLYLLLALGGAWRARRGDYAGLTALAVGAGALFLGQGLLYLPVLTSSQIGTVAPEPLLRLAAAASLMQLLPVGVVLWRAGRRVQPPEPQREAAVTPSS